MVDYSGFVWSQQQLDVFDWFETPHETIRHLVVRARAGTGKSTTIAAGVRRAPEQSILVCAFSKDIEVNLNLVLQGSRAVGKTLHALGFACVRKFRDGIKLENGRADLLSRQVCGKTAPDAVVKLVSKLMTQGRLMAPHSTKLGDLTNIQIEFECEPDEVWSASGFDSTYVEEKALAAMELAADVKSGGTIDYADMIFLPVRNGWLTKQYDLIVVDEAQDMTTTQLEIAEGVLRPGGRICIVGDDMQAIYAFMGADSGSLDRLKTKLGARELGLTMTRRCGKAIVEAAQALVPDFSAHEGNPEGSITSLPMGKLVATAGPGDFILSRVNAPLVSIAMQLLRSGKRARVAGRNIGAGLQALVRKLKAKSVPDFESKVQQWEMKETGRLEKLKLTATNGRLKTLENKIEAIKDQASMLLSLADGAKSIVSIEDRIDALFSDDGKGIAGMVTCSSVHKAKGLEADRVFVLRDTLRSHSQEEMNIQYVAMTRAKNELVWVYSERVR